MVWEDTFAHRVRHAPDDGTIAGVLALANAGGDLITLSGGFPAPETFPTEIVGGLLAGLVEQDAAVALQYSPTQGIASVRDAIAGRLAEREGVRPADGELLITSGGIDALGLLARSLIDPGDVVLVEAPSYVGAITAFAGFEADVRGVPMDDGGLDVEALAGILASVVRPKALYTIPDHQNPSGRTLAADRRLALVELCRRHGVLILEDVAYRELGFFDEPLPGLWALGPDTVVQIGTFSKILFPGIRCGWAAGPAPIITQMISAKQNADQCAGALGQRLVEEYIRGGHLDRQLVDSRRLYAERGAAMLAGLEASMPRDVTWTEPQGGFFLWLTGPATLDAVALAPEAVAAGVAYVPGAAFYPDGRGRTEIRLSFSRATEAQIAEGARRLGAVLDQSVPTTAPSGASL